MRMLLIIVIMIIGSYALPFGEVCDDNFNDIFLRYYTEQRTPIVVLLEKSIDLIDTIEQYLQKEEIVPALTPCLLPDIKTIGIDSNELTAMSKQCTKSFTKFKELSKDIKKITQMSQSLLDLILFHSVIDYYVIGSYTKDHKFNMVKRRIQKEIKRIAYKEIVQSLTPTDNMLLLKHLSNKDGYKLVSEKKMKRWILMQDYTKYNELKHMSKRDLKWLRYHILRVGELPSFIECENCKIKL